jgi:hypothetical protein
VVGEHGVSGIAIGRSTVGADLSESKIGREVNGDGDICLVKVDGLGESVTVDVVVVNAEAESDDGGCTVEVLVVNGVCDVFLNDVKLDIELVSRGGIDEGERCVGGCDAVIPEEPNVQEFSVGECSCEVVLEDNLAVFICVVKGDAGGSIFRLDVPVEVPGEIS